MSVNLIVDDEVYDFSQTRVIRYKRVIRYDLRYVILGFIVLIMLFFVLLEIIDVFLSSRSIFRNIQNMYNQTSTGRLVINLFLSEQSDPKQPSP